MSRPHGAPASLMGQGTSMVAVAIYSADPALRLRLEQLLRMELGYTVASVTHDPAAVSRMNMSWILIAFLTFLVVLVVLSYIVEALRSAPKRPAALVWAPRIPIEYVDLGGIRVRCIRTGM